ncbi:rod shape-determining protein RodA [Lentibacillus sp. CBA3610]|uniref:rod shape-determining protein RodA n=1 Tax=Lentibacillus sp. CBA3610 TaxID=2518176 RepID=UPI0020D1F9A6|nr:rod shape-determining protein RodA [Lentibacillus sp. CBA3610]
MDTNLLVLIGILFIFSLLAIYSGSGQYVQEDPLFFVKRQVMWYVVGTALMLLVAYFDYELLDRLSIFLYVGGIAFLFLVHFFGVTKNGSQRWIDLGVMELQPSEFMKIFLILLLASHLSRMGSERISFKASIPVTLKIAGYSLLPFSLILIQPDLGSSLIIVTITLTLILVSSISRKMIGILVTGMISLVAAFLVIYQSYYDVLTKVFKPHQLGRIYGWLNPNEFSSDYGYQLKQAVTGIGSGQLTGSGYNQGVQVQNGSIPEVHTDFIFAVIGEEFGFLGTSLLISIYFLLIYRIIIIALSANHLFGIYICVGTIGLLTFQVFQNIAMTIGLMPITGLALPLVSYGGSALLTNMIALGLVFSVQMRSKNYLFSN